MNIHEVIKKIINEYEMFSTEVLVYKINTIIKENPECIPLTIQDWINALYPIAKTNPTMAGDIINVLLNCNYPITKKETVINLAILTAFLLKLNNVFSNMNEEKWRPLMISLLDFPKDAKENFLPYPTEIPITWALTNFTEKILNSILFMISIEYASFIGIRILAMFNKNSNYITPEEKKLINQKIENIFKSRSYQEHIQYLILLGHNILNHENMKYLIMKCIRNKSRYSMPYVIKKGLKNYNQIKVLIPNEVISQLNIKTIKRLLELAISFSEEYDYTVPPLFCFENINFLKTSLTSKLLSNPEETQNITTLVNQYILYSEDNYYQKIKTVLTQKDPYKIISTIITSPLSIDEKLKAMVITEFQYIRKIYSPEDLNKYIRENNLSEEFVQKIIDILSPIESNENKHIRRFAFM